MAEHSIEELERQLTAAESRYRDAGKAVQEARTRLMAARVTASGLEGHVVSYVQRSWRNREGTEVRFVVKAVNQWGSDFEGPIVKKDGSLGERIARHPREGLTDHGPFQTAA